MASVKVRGQRVTARSFKFDPAFHAEHPQGKSLTVPDEATSIKELLERSMNNQTLPVAAPFGSYGEADFDSPDLEKLRDSDMIDRDEFQLNLGGQIEGYREKMKVLDERLKKAEKEKLEEQKQILAWYRKQQDQKDPEELEKPVKGVSK